MKPFYRLPTESVIAYDLLAFAVNQADWVKYHNFYATQVPFDLVFSDPTLSSIADKHKLAVGILRLDPNVVYDWHKDTKRGVCINMLLNNAESNCLFSVGNDEATHTFVELKYQLKSYYVFNNQVEHMVVNFSRTRYLMSVEFEEDKNTLTFEKLLQELVP